MDINKSEGSLYAISDIHGCYKELCDVLNKLDLKPIDTIIFMGDYVDRGPDSKSVINKIIELQSYCNVIVLKGNHEVMMKSGFDKIEDQYVLGWLQWGGKDTLYSYGVSLAEFLEDSFEIPKDLQEHLDFLDALPLFYETDTHIFVHASPKLTTPLEEQSENNLIWRRPQKEDEKLNYTHVSNKIIVSGHTAQKSGVPLKLSDKNYLIDTGCFFTGVLTVLDVKANIYITN